MGGLRAAWACKPYVILNITYLWTWLSFQVLAGNLILYLCYAVDVFDQFEFIVATVMVSTVFFLFVMFKVRSMRPHSFGLGR